MGAAVMAGQARTKTYEQLRCIWALAHDMNLSPDELRNVVCELYPETQGHLSQLIVDQAARVIDLLKQKSGYKKPPAPEKYGRQPRGDFRRLHSPAQREFALSLARQIVKRKIVLGAYENGNELKSMEDFEHEAWALLHQLSWQKNLDGFDFANTRDVAQIIEALKAMLARTDTKSNDEGDGKSPLDKS